MRPPACRWRRSSSCGRHGRGSVAESQAHRRGVVGGRRQGHLLGVRPHQGLRLADPCVVDAVKVLASPSTARATCGKGDSSIAQWAWSSVFDHRRGRSSRFTVTPGWCISVERRSPAEPPARQAEYGFTSDLSSAFFRCGPGPGGKPHAIVPTLLALVRWTSGQSQSPVNVGSCFAFLSW